VTLKPGRFITKLIFILLAQRPVVAQRSVKMPPSRQERRRAERDAAKRAPAQSGAAGAGGAAAARGAATLNVNQLGDWTTQAENPLVGPGGYCSPRHTTPFNSRNEGSKCVESAGHVCQTLCFGVG